MLFYGITAALWIGWMVLGWYMPDWVSLKGKDVWFVRILFWLIGTAIAGIVIYFKLMADRRKRALALAGEQGAELDFVLAEADRKLQASGASLATMPVVFVIDPAAPKDLATITLSYTFFEVEGGGGKT